MGKDQVGRNVLRLESAAKVDGSVGYVSNLTLPDMLHGAIVRSVVPSARIAGVDATAAWAAPGVHAVVTAAELTQVVPDVHFGPIFRDQPILAVDVVRHIGEPVAVVVAEDPRAAAAAAERVVVRYDPLPAVFDEMEAAGADAPVLHRDLRPGLMIGELARLAGDGDSNVCVHYRLRHGDVDAALANAEHVFDHTFIAPAATHAPLEPSVSVAEVATDGTVTVHTSTQTPSVVRRQLAQLFDRPEDGIRVRSAALGGGFGAKLYAKTEPLAIACALLTRRPVKISLSLDEQFTTLTRHGLTVRLQTGVSQDGQLVARRCQIWWNGGAYADIGPRVAEKSSPIAAGPYDIANVAVDSRYVYTNLPPAGAMRGFGVPELTWASECQVDLIARDLGIDPLTFRQRNVLRNRQCHATGTVLSAAATEEVLDELARALRWEEPLDRGTAPCRRGRGLAFALKPVTTPTLAEAAVSVAADGCTVYASTVDMGQGSATVLAQIAGEVLSLQAEDIVVVPPDTEVTPFDLGTLSSRSTHHMGNAVAAAAEDAGRQIIAAAAAMLQTDVGELDLHDGHVLAREGGQRLSLPDVLREGAHRIVGRGSYMPDYVSPDPATGQSPNITAFWMVGGAAAEVEVDLETGRLDVTRIVVVGDVGRAINPALARTQLTGAAVMQLGAALSEELRYDDGQPSNVGLGQYRLPGLLDVPSRLEAVLVEVPAEGAPYGAKGVGESGTFALVPAIANAVLDATGVSVNRFPLTRERVWSALQRRGAST